MTQLQRGFATQTTMHRFSNVSLVVIACLAFASAIANAQSAGPSAVRVRGAGTDTWVLISGVVGGVAGMSRMETRLVASGHRVITIDPYNLSADSVSVTFAALARRVDATLDKLGVRDARIVGHAHGGGVALRLAAAYPARVASVYLLDVGALPDNRTAMMGRAMALIPIVARMPGGRSYLHTRFSESIRENSGTGNWFDAAAERAYTEPVLDNIGRSVALVQRLSRAREPEPVATVIARIHVPVTVVIGEAPHPSGTSASELDALAPLASLLRIVRFRGVGHFPHEEAPDQLMRVLDSGAATRVAGAGK